MNIVFLSPASGQRPWSGDYKIRFVRMSVSVCVHASVNSSRFVINFNISFIHKDIFIKFAGNVYGYENMSVPNFSVILKDEMATIANCLKNTKML